MRGWHIARVRLVGICLASLLILIASVVTACGESGAGTGTAPKTTTSTAGATTASSEDETTSSFAVPVSAGTGAGDWIGGTTSTGTGPVDLHCSVTFAASQPQGAVHVSLYNEAGELIDSRDGMPYNFKGLEPGKYRLGVFGVDTGYVSQWYGGLPVQGHDISESQVLELQPGPNVAEFVLQPGLSIQGEVSWTQRRTRLSGDVRAYDLLHRDTLRSAILNGRTTVDGTEPLLAGVGYQFLIVGLLPGRYRLGVSFDAAFIPPQSWDGGGSFEDAPVIDLTSGDVTDIHVELGALPATTTTASPE